MTGTIAFFLLALAAPAVSGESTTLGEAHSTSGCHALARPVPRGAPIDAGVVEAVPCRSVKPAPVAFDRASGLAVAATDLGAGAYLGRTFIREHRGVRKGDVLRLVSTVGPVRIERVVTAMQPSDGARVFVRDQDGQVYSAPLEAVETQ